MSAITYSTSRRPSRVPRLAFIIGLAVVAIGAAVLVTLAQIPTGGGSTTGVASVNGSGAQGTLNVEVAPNDAATLTLKLSGLTPGLEYPVHLHAGTSSQPGASLGVLGMLQARADGSAELLVRSIRAGATGASVDLTGSLLADGPRFIDVHAEGAPNPIAVGTIPAVSSR